MSLSDLTRNAFQSGLSPTKWAGLCQMFLWRDSTTSQSAALAGSEAEISRSVLMLFEYYPGDTVLQAYLKEAIQNKLISLVTFVSTFLQAARSRALRDPATLYLVCRTIQEARLWSEAASSSAPLLSEDPNLALETVRDALELLRAAFDPMLPAQHFQRVVGSVGSLVLSLINPTPNVVNASGALALECIENIKDLLLHPYALEQNLKQSLENLAVSLSFFLDDHSSLTSRGSLSGARSSLGQADILGPGQDNDITTCSLLLSQMIMDRGGAYGSGHEAHVTALIVTAFRTNGLPLPKFLLQLLQAAIACLMQDLSLSTNKRQLSLWNAFVAGRLPRLLVSFEQALGMDGIPATDFRAALCEALNLICLGDPLSSPLVQYESMWSIMGSNHLENSDKTSPFTRVFTYQLYSFELVDQAFAAKIDPSLTDDTPSRLQAEAREAGVDFELYLSQKFSPDISAADTRTFLQRIYSDPISHTAFAEMIRKRFDVASSNSEIETLGHISRILSANEAALDLVSLHTGLSPLVSGALALVEGYDGEAVGDPQSSLGHLGDIVLFLQLTSARFKIPDTLQHKNGTLDMGYLRRTDGILSLPAMPEEEVGAFKTWFKALFDKNSEGIEDGIIRTTRPKTLLAISATIFMNAVRTSGDRKLDPDVLNNGISYFLGPLLGWTLPGIILALVRDIRASKFSSRLQHLNVLRILLLSPSLPRPVLSLCGPSVLRLLFEGQGITTTLDIAAFQSEVVKAIGASIPDLGSSQGPSPVHWGDQPRQAIQYAIASIQSDKGPPSLNVAACLIECSPTDFLRTFWVELNMSLKTGLASDAAKRFAIFVLATPRSNPRSPPLLPIFLHNIVPSLIDRFDHPKPGQPMAGDLELLVAVVASCMMSALQLERALQAASCEEAYPLGSSSSSMASGLASDLRHRQRSATAKFVAQRLTSSQTFVANFPVFKTEI
ncbi:hypothetical protein BC834DRAFT_2384 [Gloeopeniophorella convolvens]|nr:hypothetical protein BC834DRAFT_2384 [Gloeopeniophorella convolvens]